MTLRVELDVRHEFSVKAPLAEVLTLLADVAASASHFPQVQSLESLGDGVWRWEMQRVGTRSVHIQTIYASRYTHDKARGTVTWAPVPGVGNALIGGSWRARRGKPGTRLLLKTDGVVELKLPALMTRVVAPLVKSEFNKLVAEYVGKLTTVFGGPA
jgi:carbon monoxide dehydrogenase subunit G